MKSSLHYFDAIKEEKKKFTKIMLETTKILFESQQRTFKKSVKSNRGYPVEIKIINRSFSFDLFRFKCPTDLSNYLQEII